MVTVHHLGVLRYICFLCVFLYTIYFLRSYLFSFYSNYSKQISTINSIDLNVITDEKLQCVKTKLLLDKYRTTVCVHDVKRDSDVSGLLIKAGIWEEHLVTRFVRILSTHRQLAFIDIGANVGVYTMYAASLGCPNVISIECFGPNIERIRRAIQLEKVQEQVVLIPRALYEKSDVYLSLRANIANNIGSQRLNKEVSRDDKDPLVVKTIRFDDLLSVMNERNIQEAVIKIDIETSEHFLCETGEQMFNQVNIPFVMMEWANIKSITARATLIYKFFIKRNYIPFNSETCQPETEKDFRQWSTQDIYWIKKNYTHFCKV
jgi:FkbM family methyltransferase